MKKLEKKHIYLIIGIVLGLFILIGGSYAYFKLQLSGTKSQIITAGDITLILNEGEDLSQILASVNYPVKDDVGKANEEFTFSLENPNTVDVGYTIYLADDTLSDGATRVDDQYVKYYMVKNGVEQTPALLNTLTTNTNGRILDSGVLSAKSGDTNTINNYTLRFWLDYDADNNAMGKEFSVKLVVIAEQIPEKVAFASTLAEKAQTPTETMFNYTSEGCVIDDAAESQICPVSATNGIYTIDDDDGPSYFYRGEVDNLVQFAEYETDYYVYRYVDEWGSISEFTSLDACKFAGGDDTNCVYTKKYDAGTPMYWRIIRVNGDGTIRMIYSGTTKDAIQSETGIGLSRYNEEYDDPKYTGYTYDRTTTEVKSDAKTEIDNWYATYLANTEYDQYVADGKFCSDSSGYDETTETFNTFARTLELEVNSNPTFKCAPTEETYGGSYTLKAGLITHDEIIAAGGQDAKNNSYYLYNGNKGENDGSWFWSMSPASYTDVGAFVGYVRSNGLSTSDDVPESYGLLRPVINLRTDVVFKEGTDGSVATPYELDIQ